MERYSVPRHKFSSLSDEEYQKSVVTPIQLRVFNVIKYVHDMCFRGRSMFLCTRVCLSLSSVVVV